ncbi:holo-ACP synthase [Domibacillus mangrovi]|uniref:Holo-[acyl-carrier-protein] synthase n=1 Tax=Domibacillus mangrovi TaxID=1714354 RepID=A0A1Q5P2J5_9BACI|nr:holo-ACP synthase [Domibacillus mangrovi]OKL36467.1 holo-ACP synthase [Domibacillus mangrovi]
MIKGIGMDIVEIDRIRRLIERQPRFIERILTSQELTFFHDKNGSRKWEYAAGRFAVKEAFSKAEGTGIGEQLSFQDIEISSDDKGRPILIRPYSEGVHITITHSREYAAAVVVIE